MRLIRHNREIPDFPQHEKGTRSTVVFDKPDVLEIFQELRKQYTKSCMKVPKITVNIGCAMAYYKDCFNKKLGRKLAESRIKPVEMVINNHSLYSGGDEAVWLVLDGVDEQLKVRYSMNIKVYRDSGEMRVLACYTRAA